MLDVVVRVNGKIVKYVSAKNINQAESRSRPSTYIVRPTNTNIQHRQRDHICSLAAKMLKELEKWEMSAQKDIEDVRKDMQSDYDD